MGAPVSVIQIRLPDISIDVHGERSRTGVLAVCDQPNSGSPGQHLGRRSPRPSLSVTPPRRSNHRRQRRRGPAGSSSRSRRCCRGLAVVATASNVVVAADQGQAASRTSSPGPPADTGVGGLTIAAYTTGWNLIPRNGGMFSSFHSSIPAGSYRGGAMLLPERAARGHSAPRPQPQRAVGEAGQVAARTSCCVTSTSRWPTQGWFNDHQHVQMIQAPRVTISSGPTIELRPGWPRRRPTDVDSRLVALPSSMSPT